MTTMTVERTHGKRAWPAGSAANGGAVLAATAALMALMASPALAEAKPERLAVAAQGAQACQNLPDTRATTAALKAAGFVTAEANGQLKVFTDRSRKVMVGITTDQNKRIACVVSTDGLSEAQAASLIQPWVAAAGAKPAAVGTGSIYAASWSGSFKGGPVELLIAKTDNVVTFRGAAIVARSLR